MNVVRLSGLAEAVGAFPRDHRGANMVAYLARRHPQAISRTDLMTIGAFAENIQGRLTAYTAFEWWVMRSNGALRHLGWRIDDTNEKYRLIKL
jgi:exonuclease III